MRRSLLNNKNDDDEHRNRIRFAFFLFFSIITLSIVLPLTLSGSGTITTCVCPLITNYSFNYVQCTNCGKCITFLNNSLYYLAGNNTRSFIYPFSIINGTAVYGTTNQINNQSLRFVYGCGRKDDTTIYVSSDAFGLSTVSTISQNQTNLNGTPLYSRGFALVNYTQLFKVSGSQIFFGGSVYSNLTLYQRPCIPLTGYGLSWDPITNDTFIIYADTRTTNNRHIGQVDLFTGIVKPTCVNITRSFQSMEFDSFGALWVLVGNAGPDASKIFNISKAPCILNGNITCETFGTPKGTEILSGNGFGNPTKMSIDGTTIIAGTSSYALVYRYYQNDWYKYGNTLTQPLSAVGISGNGDTIAIGNKFQNHTRVYKFENCSWVQMGSDVVGGGYAISLSPDGLTIASSLADDSTINASSGRTYIHDWDGSQWNVRGESINGVSAFDYSGFDISLYGNNRIAIGIIEDTGAGRTEIYQWSGTAWVQLGATIIGEGLADNSGNSVSLQNDTVAIGAWQNDGNGTDSGSTRIYKWNETHWNQLGQDIDGELANDYSGTTVSLSTNGKTVAIGALFNPFATENGQVRIYDYVGSTWIQRGYDIDGPNFARAGICSMSGDATSVAVGAALAGTVNVYCINSPM